jgi:hypothetical protein
MKSRSIPTIRTIRRIAPMLTCAALLAQPAFAQDKPAAAPKQPALNEVDCRTLLKLDGEERGYTLVYLHGFVSGKTGELNLAAQTLSEVTDRVIDHCIDKPGDKLLAVFEQMRKKK